jgi:hypothetical protein
MPVFALAPAAATAFWGAVGTGTAAGLGAFGAHEQASGATSAANTQAAAAKYAADIQAKANADALAFQKQQAALNAQQANAVQQANYNQWASQQRAASDFGQMYGLPARNIPAYVPLPGSDGSTSGAASNGSSSAFPSVPSSGNAMDTSAIQNVLKQNYAALGVSPTGPGSGPTDIAYYAGKIAETGGLTPQNFSYWFGPSGRIASDLGKSGGGASSTPAANSFASITPTSINTPIAPMAMGGAGTYNATPNSFAYLIPRV